MEHWFTRTLTGCAPADAECERALKRYALGSTFPMDLATRKTRSGAWHRKYWVLCSMLAANLESVEVEDGLTMPIRCAEDVHVALKYATGLYDSYALEAGVVRVVKSTAFDRMSPDEWAAYWPRVLDAVHQRFLPGVELRHVEDEIARMAS